MGYWKGEKDLSDEKFKAKETVKDIEKLPFAEMPERKLRKETCQKFGVRMAVSTEDGKTPIAYYFPYYDQSGRLSGYKKRDLTLSKHDKYHYTAVGKVGVDCKLFGQQVAESVSRKRANLLYVEGETDVLSCWQAMVDSVKGTKYSDLQPHIVGLSCGTVNSVEATLHNKDFVLSFDALCMGFDNDSSTEAEKKKGIKRGLEARNDVANALVGSGLNMFIVDYPNGAKDPSDMLQADQSAELAKILSFNKRQYSAEKIIKASDVSLDEILAPRKQGIFIPEFPELMNKIKGFRLRELVLLTSPSGVGKSTVVSKFSAGIMQQGKRVGMIYLEETKVETIQRMIAAKLKVNYNKFKNDPLSVATREAIAQAKQEIDDNDQLVLLDHFGSLPISELMNKIRHMHLVEKCDYIFIDHLSMVISGSDVENERKELDMVMTELAAFAAANDVGIIAISHIKRLEAADLKAPKGKEDKPFWVRVTKEMMRGSAALEQLSWIVIGLEPEILPDRKRGRVRLTTLKNRPWSYLGECDIFTMDEDTWEVILSVVDTEF